MFNIIHLRLQPCVRGVYRWAPSAGNLQTVGIHFNVQTSSKVASSCPSCQKTHQGHTGKPAFRTHTTKVEPKEKNQTGDGNGNVSLEQGVRLSRQGCDSVPARKVGKSKPPEKPHPGTEQWILPEGYNTGIKMFNSLTRRKEPLILPLGKVASWWVIYLVGTIFISWKSAIDTDHSITLNP